MIDFIYILNVPYGNIDKCSEDEAMHQDCISKKESYTAKVHFGSTFVDMVILIFILLWIVCVCYNKNKKQEEDKAFSRQKRYTYLQDDEFRCPDLRNDQNDEH